MKELIDKYVSEEIQQKVEEKKSLILTILVVIGALAICAGVAYIVYRIMTGNMADEDLEVEEIDEDEDFFESEDE